MENAIAGGITAPQYFRTALFSKDYPAGKKTKEETVTTSGEERGRREECSQVEWGTAGWRTGRRNICNEQEHL